MQFIKHRSDLHKLLIPNVYRSICAELGVAEGFFSADMLSWGIKQLYMVDRWESVGIPGDSANPQEWHNRNYEAAKKRVEKYGDKAVILRGPTTAMAQHVADESLDLIHIDADHSYNGVMGDLMAWYGKVKAGGIISGHDYLAPHYGVNRAVNEFCKARGIQVFCMEENKPEDAGFYFIKP